LHVTGYGDDPAYQMSLESGTVSRALEISSLQTCIDFFYEVHHRHKRDLFLFYIFRDRDESLFNWHCIISRFGGYIYTYMAVDGCVLLDKLMTL
jgi:uncharacterized protein YjaZ